MELQKQNKDLVLDKGIGKALISGAILLGLNYTPQILGVLVNFIETHFPDVEANELYSKFEALVLSGFETKSFSLNAQIIVKALNPKKLY